MKLKSCVAPAGERRVQFHRYNSVLHFKTCNTPLLPVGRSLILVRVAPVQERYSVAVSRLSVCFPFYDTDYMLRNL
jgi:hypothetical protein